MHTWLGAGSPSLTMINITVSGNKARSGGGLWLGGVLNRRLQSGLFGTQTIAWCCFLMHAYLSPGCGATGLFVASAF